MSGSRRGRLWAVERSRRMELVVAALFEVQDGFGKRQIHQVRSLAGRRNQAPSGRILVAVLVQA